MTYTMPELHLVGSAQHLVLGDEKDPFTRLRCELDDIVINVSDIVELW